LDPAVAVEPRGGGGLPVRFGSVELFGGQAPVPARRRVRSDQPVDLQRRREPVDHPAERASSASQPISRTKIE